MKRHTASERHRFSTESILEQAWDDIVMLDNAVEAWPTGNGSYVPEYLLLLMAAQDDRGRSALSLLEVMDTSGHQEEVRGLKELYQKGHDHFLEILDTSSKEIEILFRETKGLGLRLSALDELLVKVCRIVEDGILFNSADWLHDDLDTAGEEYLQIFTDMARMIHGAPQGLTSIPSFETWRLKFEQLEIKFKTKFSYFSALAGNLQRLKKREYNQQELWWLRTSPGDEPVIEPILSDEQLKNLGSFFLPQSVRQSESSCPDQELVIAYALNDAIGEQKKLLVKEHIKHCKSCLMTILDIRSSADTETKQTSDEDWAEILKKIPAWRLLPEQRYKIAIEFPEKIPSLPSRETLPACAAAIMAARPSTASLPMMQDSNNQTVSFAKVVTVAEDKMIALFFIQMYTVHSSFEKGKLHIIGKLEDFEPKEGTVYHCDWMDPDNNITIPDEFQVTDTGFTAVFDFKGTQEKPNGHLRVLIFQEQ